MKKLLLFSVISICTFSRTFAQTPTDANMMVKGQFCGMVGYGQSSWTNYWEGELKRDNGNIGTLTMQSITAMANVGVSDKVNILVSVPYIITKASAGQMAGREGVQDLSAWVKYNFLKKAIGTGTFRAFVVGGVSTPLSDYVPDAQPFSIGFGSKTGNAKLIVNYKLNNGIYLTAHGAYTLRGNVKVDRSAYLSGRTMINSNEVALPDVFDYAVRLGVQKKHIQADIFLDQSGCVSGDDIRRQDMPFLTNKMQMMNVGAMAKYIMDNGLEFQATATQCIAGRNAGQITNFSVALLYTFQLFGKK